MADRWPDGPGSAARVDPLEARVWHPVALVLGCGLCAALLLSWFVDPSRSFWLAIDETVFWALNDSLAWCDVWTVSWALANHWMGDLIQAVSMVGVYLHFMLYKGRHAWERFVAVGMMLTGLVVAGIQIDKVMAFDRESPTLVHPSARLLSESAPWISTKDISGDSFPGDHATVLLLCAGVFTVYLPRAHAAVAWVLAVVFMLPRLVAGAHWMTDLLVGSTAVAGLLISCTFATPLHRVVVDRLERMIGRVSALRRSSQ